EVEEVLAVAEGGGAEGAALAEGGGVSVDDPVEGGDEAGAVGGGVAGFEAGVADGALVALLGVVGIAVVLPAVVEVDLAPVGDLDAVGDPERAVVRVGVGVLDEHGLALGRAEWPDM